MRYKWKATYKDGTEFPQFDKAGENLFKDIDFSQVVKFGWYDRCAEFDVKAEGEKETIVYSSRQAKFEVRVKEGEEIIAFRRHVATMAQDRILQYGLGIKGRFVMLIDSLGNVEAE
jgi:hypothetical protein